jgi:hypothetical protein
MQKSLAKPTKWLSCGLVWLALSGCTGTTLQASQPRIETARWARVEVTEVDRDILSFDVYNLSKLNLVILRDKIVLETAQGRRGREPGGLQSYYNVAPGAMHDVKVKFDLSDCQPGQPVKVLFESALLVDGTPVPMAPLPFVCR